MVLRVQCLAQGAHIFRTFPYYLPEQPLLVEVMWKHSRVTKGIFLLPGHALESAAAARPQGDGPANEQQQSRSVLGAFHQSFDSAPSAQVKLPVACSLGLWQMSNPWRTPQLLLRQDA